MYWNIVFDVLKSLILYVCSSLYNVYLMKLNRIFDYLYQTHIFQLTNAAKQYKLRYF